MRPQPDFLVRIAGKLRPLRDRLVFVGNAVRDLYLTRPVTRTRLSRQVDVVCDAEGLRDFTRFARDLRALGFRPNGINGDIDLHWRDEEDALYVVPVDCAGAGFSSRWYPYGFRTARNVALGRELIRILTPPVYLATKLEAFEDRGTSAPFRSHDLEDVVALIAGRPSLPDEVESATPELAAWIRDRLAVALPTDAADELVAAHLPDSRYDPLLVDDVVHGVARLVRGRPELAGAQR